jgi:nitrite reductase (NO-forming)
MPPYIPFPNIVSFFMHQDDFFRVDDIGSDPENIPSAPQSPDDDGIVRISLAVREVIAEVTPDVYFNYWTYDEQVPGPFLRIREGDTVELTISNHETSLHAHNIDLHAVTGPGGGATLTNVEPGQTKTFQFKALNPGLYVYHCAMPNVSAHNSHGQYGLILVEPNGGLAPVDKEFYVMQGELYTMGDIGKRGLVAFDAEALIDGLPNYVTFNGRVESTPRMTAQVGDRIRMYVGNGGVNLISSFHAIGEIFDRVYPEGAIGPSSAILENVQTTAVLPGGSTIVEFTVDVPGKYLLVDHALARMNKGAWAVLEVTGEEQPHIFRSIGESEADAFHSAAYH